MAITKNDVTYIANLARLALTEAEIEHFQTQLEVILAYIDKLKKLDVCGTAPTAHVLEMKNVYRPDKVRSSLSPGVAVGLSPAHEGNFFKVPKVIE